MHSGGNYVKFLQVDSSDVARARESRASPGATRLALCSCSQVALSKVVSSMAPPLRGGSVRLAPQGPVAQGHVPVRPRAGAKTRKVHLHSCEKKSA